MGFLSDVLYGSSTTKPAKPTHGWNNPDSDYDDYYGSLHDDAICGDREAAKELREEFGDDWDEEY